MKVIEWFNGIDVNLKVVIISSGTTLILYALNIIFKHISDRLSYTHKLKVEYKYEQSKKLKEMLAQYKSLLLSSAEEVNYRLWNLLANIKKGWNQIDVNEWTNDSKYYIQSFVYRFLKLYNVINKIENNLGYIDVKVAQKEDYKYLKYLKVLAHVFCDAKLITDAVQDYDTSNATSHFFKDKFRCFPEYLNENGNIITFSEFKEKIKNGANEILDVIKYINMLSEEDVNYRVMQLFHLLLVVFLNTYGYDYHITSKKDMTTLINKYKANLLLNSFLDFLDRNKLLEENEIKRMKNIILEIKTSSKKDKKPN